MAPTTKLQIPPYVRQVILEVWPWAELLLEAVRVLVADEPERELVETVSLGVEVEQAPLSARPASLIVGD